MRSWAARVVRAQDAPMKWHETFQLHCERRGNACKQAELPSPPTLPLTASPSPPPLDSSLLANPPVLMTSSGAPPSSHPELHRQSPESLASPDEAPHDAVQLAKRLAELDALVSSSERELATLRTRVQDLESKLASCAAMTDCSHHAPSSSNADSSPGEDRVLSTGGDAHSTARSNGADVEGSRVPEDTVVSSVVPPRMCWIALLDRPGGAEVQLQAARLQVTAYLHAAESAICIRASC